MVPSGLSKRDAMGLRQAQKAKAPVTDSGVAKGSKTSQAEVGGVQKAQDRL